MLSIDIDNVVYPGVDAPALRPVQLEIEDGSNVMIFGGNASGKSTFGRVICGLLNPSRGHVRVDKKDVSALRGKERVRAAYYIGQEYRLSFFRGSIIGELDFAARMAQARPSIDLDYESFDLPDPSITPLDLPSCKAWRLNLLIGYVIEPRVLFIDELPTLKSRGVLRCLSRVLAKRSGNGLITLLSYQRFIELEDMGFNRHLKIVNGKIDEL